MTGSEIAWGVLGFIALALFVASVILSLTKPTDGEDDPYDGP